jgi:predicted NBD/HSP70 family sugar kinase
MVEDGYAFGERVTCQVGGHRADGAGVLLQTLLRQGPSPRSRLAHLSGLSPASVTGHSANLIDRGLVTELPEAVARTGMGRPYVPLDLNTCGTLVGGVHVAVEETTVALLDLRGTIVAERIVPHAGTEPDAILRTAADVLRSLMAARTPRVRPLGVGLATGGWVDRDAGVVVEHPMLGWRDVPAARLLAGMLGGVDVHLDSHIRALVRAEQLFGRLDPRHSVLALFVGNVVDAAYAVGEHAICGPRSGAGDLAHWRVAGSDWACVCGQTGCLQATLSERRLVADGLGTGVIGRSSFDELLAAAEAGSAVARDLFRERAAIAGRALGPLIDFLNPDTVLIVEPGIARFAEASTALLATLQEHSAVVRGRRSSVAVSSFMHSPLATAGGTVALDVLYRDPLAVEPRRAGV